MTAHDLLRTVRTRRGLTQAELARRAQMQQPVISAYERGRRDPSIGMLRRILAAAGEELQLSASPRGGSDLPPPRDLDEHGRRLVDLLLLADALPQQRVRPLDAPRLRSSR